LLEEAKEDGVKMEQRARRWAESTGGQGTDWSRSLPVQPVERSV
jgi:hypothetical protein